MEAAALSGPVTPEVALVGDSIRKGYEETVRRELAPGIRVRSPEPNGGPSRNVLDHLDAWVLDRPPDAAHLNCGLHDLAKSFDSGLARVPLGEYRGNVARILERVQAAGILPVWATITPVDEVLHHRNKSFDRFEADVDAYNEAGREAAEAAGVAVNDLFGVIESAGRGRLLRDDGVHFTGEGSRLLGEAVAAFVRRLPGFGPGGAGG